MRPAPADHPPFFESYISLVTENDTMEAFKNQLPQIESLLQSINEEKSKFAYAEGKWTLKELLQHMIDTDRIFSYRAMCFARKETTSLPSFDENLYAQNSNANERTWSSLCNEFLNLRKSTEDMFESFTEEMLATKGTANNNQISVRSLASAIIGHAYHHIMIIKERYL